jgi:hypothetical protein
MTIKAYDPKKVSLSIGGVNPTGYAPDTKIVFSRANPVSTTTVGVDGDISVNEDNRKNGTMTISLLHNSSFNDVITSWLLTKPTGYPFLPFEFNDPSGSATTSRCWVETQPDYSVGQETGTLDWVFGVEDATLKPNQTVARLDALKQFTGAVLV